jgi:hypothetical protein
MFLRFKSASPASWSAIAWKILRVDRRCLFQRGVPRQLTLEYRQLFRSIQSEVSYICKVSHEGSSLRHLLEIICNEERRIEVLVSCWIMAVIRSTPPTPYIHSFNRRRVCRKTPISDPPSPVAPHASKTVLDTSRRTRLIADAKAQGSQLLVVTSSALLVFCHSM